MEPCEGGLAAHKRRQTKAGARGEARRGRLSAVHGKRRYPRGFSGDFDRADGTGMKKVAVGPECCGADDDLAGFGGVA